jgi:hypothetical protein
MPRAAGTPTGRSLIYDHQFFARHPIAKLPLDRYDPEIYTNVILDEPVVQGWGGPALPGLP